MDTTGILTVRDKAGAAATATLDFQVTRILTTILGCSYDNPYGNLATHGYVGLNGRTQHDEPQDPAWAAVNITALLAGMPGKGLHMWPEVIAGVWDDDLRMTASRIRPGAHVALFHEQSPEKGTRADYLAAFAHTYNLIKADRPDLLIGPCPFGSWFDPGWRDAQGHPLTDWLPAKMDLVGADRYVVDQRLGDDFDTTMEGFFNVHPELPHVIFETAAPATYAGPYYASIEVQAPAHPNLLGLYLWLGKGPRGDYRVAALTLADRLALDSLVGSTAFGR